MKNLSRLLNPASIVVIGGGPWNEAVLEQAQKFGYPGHLYAVHPSKPEIAGIKTYAGAHLLPEAPDAAFIGINREASVGAAERLRKKGAGGAVCFASGFAEATAEDATGAGAQDRLLRAAGDMPILGPNCYGFINALDQVAIWPDQHGLEPVESGVAILTQSSNMSINLTMQTRGLPIAMMVTCGNQAQTGQAEIAEYLLEDPRITAIGLHIEGVHDLRSWEALAAKAHAKNIPIVALKVGLSEQARAATVSHTASMAGSDAGAHALLMRLGIARVNDLPTFLETLKLFHVTGRIESNRIASISCSGGEASLIADMAEGRNLTFPPLNNRQKKDLRDSLGPKVALANPLDYHTYIWRDTDAMTKAWSAMADPDIAATFLIVDYPREDICDPTDWECATAAAIAMRNSTRQAVAMVATLPELMPLDTAKRLLAAGVVPFAGLAEALTAVEVAAMPMTFDPEPILLPELPKESTVLSEHDAKTRLADFGLVVPANVAVASAENVADECAHMRFPVAVKAVGLVHKSDQGGVALNIATPQEAQQAASNMREASSFLIEEMAPAGVELLIGVHVDAAHGYVLTLAAGGIWTEMLQDQTHLLLPTTETQIKQALTHLKIDKALKGYRSQPAVDLRAIWQAVDALQSYILANPGRIVEIEINPLICTPQGATAVDALIREAK